ncbi:hypothetical protein WH47_10426 [Habropoda laboriosa]|uniref:Uncharacterized protein n=1 Tax=Habropoda laboriosa TaxID=597456 RepID=A0A0L7RFP3_9HYME|nr:hypothetical protein WH47_10426 [Habropoda laboriosa]
MRRHLPIRLPVFQVRHETRREKVDARVTWRNRKRNCFAKVKEKNSSRLDVTRARKWIHDTAVFTKEMLMVNYGQVRVRLYCEVLVENGSTFSSCC